MRPIVVWFRRDLRIDDNASLVHASRTGAPVIPLFIYDSDIIRRIASDGAAFEFQAESLIELQTAINNLGGKLIVRAGKAIEVHKQIISDQNPAVIYFNRDYEPSAIRRDELVRRLYESNGIEVKSFKDMVLQEPWEVLTADEKPYVVFSPYSNAWKKQAVPPPLGKCARFTTPRMESAPILRALELKKPINISAPAFKGGEMQAHKTWRAFLNRKASTYEKGRDLPAISGTSRMSAYLRFGCISIRKIVDDCKRTSVQASTSGCRSLSKYLDELIWREFYQSVLYHFPGLLESNHRKHFDRMPWKFNPGHFDSWREGRTGYPLVDAGMRQLNQTGWMHNRVRMVVASFLTKDLLHDWKLGAHYFEEKLMDIETASNNGGWQWAASTGVDPRPLRIFNPRLQSERFDPDGEYIKKYVPELRKVPKKLIHAPHDMTSAMQSQTRCRIGKDYPSPVVDHAEASSAYKTLFAKMKNDLT
jgi:deoxyribodipyrimidine photo-lyase